MRARLRGERGQSLVEFALVAQVFLLLLFVLMQASIAWFDRLALEEGARDAARQAIVSSSLGPAQMKQVAIDKFLSTASNLNASTLASTIQVTSPTWKEGDEVTVSASYPWHIGAFGLDVGGTLHVSTAMRIE